MTCPKLYVLPLLARVLKVFVLVPPNESSTANLLPFEIKILPTLSLHSISIAFLPTLSNSIVFPEIEYLLLFKVAPSARK